jgi:antitoxin component of MazEF toxin-antitoxin module
MTITIKMSEEDAIAIPAQMLAELNLREGDQVRVVIEGDTLRLERLDRFLQLRGVYANDEKFDRAMELMDRAWQEWTTTPSA